MTGFSSSFDEHCEWYCTARLSVWNGNNLYINDKLVGDEDK